MKKEVEYSWLQISDLHIYDNTEWNFVQRALQNLPNKEDIKFIIVTGDLHQYGEDYSKTKIFLEKLLQIYNLSKKDIFIVPGNHDSGDCEDKEVYTLYIDQKVGREHDCYRKYFVKNKLLECFEDYNNFIKDFYGDVAKDMYPSPEAVSVLNWNDKINIINLNTAIICDGNNKKKQIIDIYKLSNIENEIDKANPSIMIAHHAFDFLWKSHQIALARYITNWRVSAYLCGDLHKEFQSSIQTHAEDNSSIPCIVCGKASPEYLDEYSDIGCIVYSKYKDSNKVQVNSYIWDSDKKKYSPFHGMDSDTNEYSFKLLYQEEYMGESKILSRPKYDDKDVQSIWLPDAETAHGRQARFGDFTSTQIIEEFIAGASNIYGLTAVKGIGKTFLLQIKKSRTNRDTICLPVGVKADSTNNWGIDDIAFGYDTDLSSLKEYRNIVLLWKYSIVVYCINQMINISNNANSKWWTSVCPEKELKDSLDNLLKKGQIGEETFSVCTDLNYNKLDVIIKYVIDLNNWYLIVKQDLKVLLQLRRVLKSTIGQLGKESISIFIDKIDQSLTQTNAEPPVNCDECKKQNHIETCCNENKSEGYCFSNEATCKINCCYGCEKYVSPYSNVTLRKYNDNKVYGHINLWQHFQLALVEAVSQIKAEYGDIIKIYFTIRQEALACENWLLGDNRKKITSILRELWYTKEEQRQIFYDCIRHQEDELLFDASLKNDFKRVEESFVGVGYLCHPFATNLSESVFDSIYRHSFDRTRDLQEYGEMLTKNMQKIRDCETTLERGEEVKNLIEKMAAKLAFSVDDSINSINGSYYHEKVKFLPNHWADPDNFKRLILMFDRNLLFSNQVKTICRKYNGIKKCSSKCENCTAELHPISMLYHLGMLGHVHINANNNTDIEQKFLHSKEITYIKETRLLNINSQSIYMLHPALTKSIELLKHSHIRHFTGFILGKECKVSKNKLECLMADNKTLSKKAFEEKYFYNYND